MPTRKNAGNNKTSYLFALFLVVLIGVFYFVWKSVSKIPREVRMSSTEWPLPNRNYENTRATVNSSINTSSIGELGVAWEASVAGGTEWGGAATNPIILDGKVYFEDLKSNIYAVDLESGTLDWKKEYNDDGYGPNGVVVGYEKVFALKGHYEVVALDLSGKEIWKVALGDETEGIDIQPTVYNNMVYVSTVPGVSNATFYTGGKTGKLYALDVNTGEVKWSFDTVDTKDIWGNQKLNSGGGAWYPPAVDTNTGKMYWGIGNPGPWPGTKDFPNGLSREGDNLYTNSLLSLSNDTGNIEWFKQITPHDLFDYDFQSSPILTTAMIGGRSRDIVIGSGKSGKVVVFDRSNGEILWERKVGVHQNDELTVLPKGVTRVIPGPLGGVETPMAFSDETIFVPVVNLGASYEPTRLVPGSIDFKKGTGELVALSVSDGSVKWKKDFNSINIGGATVVNDLVFTSTNDGMMYALRVEDGEVVWRYQAKGGINGWPAVSGDYIIWPVGVGDNPKIMAFKVGGKMSEKEKMTQPPAVPSSTETSAEITINLTSKNMAFDKKTITVQAGKKISVIMTNQDEGIKHNFSVYDSSNNKAVVFKGKLIDGGESITYTFTAPTKKGIYLFQCDPHSWIMNGDFIVQ